MDYRAAAELSRLAAACAAHLPNPATVAAGPDPQLEGVLSDLVQALCSADPRFTVDRQGRPAIVEAVRQALPRMEREMFNDLLEDHAGELAATKEALLQVALAYGRSLARLYP